MTPLDIRNILVVGPFAGELGYEVGNWLPYVNLHVEGAAWDDVHVWCQAGHEGLYTFIPGAKMHPFAFPYKMTHQEGNFLAAWDRAGAVACYRAVLADAERDARGLLERSIWRNHVMMLRCGEGDDHWLYAPGRPVVLRPDRALVDKWRDKLPRPFAVIACRDYARGESKNTPRGFVAALSGELERVGLHSVACGVARRERRHLGSALNLVNQTTLADLIAIYSLAACVVGASSGIIHLAAACGTPHVTWGGANWGDITQLRYERIWNRAGTKCTFLETPGYSWEIDPGRVAATVAPKPIPTVEVAYAIA